MDPNADPDHRLEERPRRLRRRHQGFRRHSAREQVPQVDQDLARWDVGDRRRRHRAREQVPQVDYGWAQRDGSDRRRCRGAR